MNYRKKAISVILLAVMVISSLYAGNMGLFTQEDLKEFVSGSDETLHIWYDDEALTDYLNCAAINYKEQTGIRVVPVLSGGAEYLEKLNAASVSDPDNAKKAADSDDIPDLYLIGNDSLEKAYLAGLAIQVKDTGKILNTQTFPQTALNAVTYQDKLIGYPLSYETSVLLYNKTYLEEMAKSEIQAKADENGEEVPQSDLLAEEIETRVGTMIPGTIDDILTFADQFDAPEAVEAVFKWDVSDIFYNYFIVGNYMSVGGESGDDKEQISIYNPDTIKCLRVYQNLNQFFSIDTKEVTYDSVLQEFIDGKIVYSVVTTDAIAKLEQAKEDGSFGFEYGISQIPAISEEMDTRSLSVTSTVAINGYSIRQAEAEKFAKFLVDDYVSALYSKTKKPAARLDVTYENEKVGTIMEEYSRSVSMPKMLATSNFWVQLEICFTNAWLGEDVNALLKQLSEQIMTQVTGEEYTEAVIVEKVTNTEEIIDEGMEE